MLIGEQPGDQEDRQGQPFVGPAGRLLHKALEEAEVDPATVYRTNAVKHFRFTGTQGKRRIHRAPDLAHMRACAPWLAAEMELVAPSGVVLLGATAGKAVFGSDFRVTKVRGTVVDWPESAPGQPAWAVPTVHPSAVLRSKDREALFADLVADLTTARQSLAS
jgi:DNA polymerase